MCSLTLRHHDPDDPCDTGRFMKSDKYFTYEEVEEKVL